MGLGFITGTGFTNEKAIENGNVIQISARQFRSNMVSGSPKQQCNTRHLNIARRQLVLQFVQSGEKKIPACCRHFLHFLCFIAYNYRPPSLKLFLVGYLWHIATREFLTEYIINEQLNQKHCISVKSKEQGTYIRNAGSVAQL